MSDTLTPELTFAVPKGRILAEAMPVMARAGVVPEAAFHDKANRALSFASEDGGMRIIRVRAFDVATFVANGAAQAGIVGSDVVEEFDYPELYAPVDLEIGQCRLSIATPAGTAGDILQGETPVQHTKLSLFADPSIPGLSLFAKPSHVRVATKYPNLTRRYFEEQGIQAECIKLNGAMELAPSLGLSQRIVDLVDTGRTLEENGLVEVATILKVSSRLVVNRAALKTDPRVAALVDAFRAAVSA
jgi:ATP phosphoribosyltransferase